MADQSDRAAGPSDAAGDVPAAATRYAALDGVEEMAGAIAALSLRPGKPVLVLLGGAAGLPHEAADALRPLFEDAVAPIAERLGVTVIDGGTDAGVMGLMGRARARTGGSFPLVGVVASGTVRAPADPGADAVNHLLTGTTTGIEPGHSHILVVPGSAWGDESPWMYRLAERLRGEGPAVTLLVEGGSVTMLEAALAGRQGHRVVVVAGSGRTADALVAAAQGADPPLGTETLVASGAIEVVEGTAGALASALERLLGRASMSGEATQRATAGETRARSDSLRDVFEASDLATRVQPHERAFLRARWLDQIDYMQRRARTAKRRYHLLRMTTVIGGVIVPALISISLGQVVTDVWVRWATFAVSLVVAVSAGIEEFLRYGEQWRHYRRTAERLKVEGWQFLTRTGPYAEREVQETFQIFADQVEKLLSSDVQDFLDRVVIVNAPAARHQVFTDLKRS